MKKYGAGSHVRGRVSQNLHASLERVRHGEEILVEHDHRAFAIIKPLDEPGGQTTESIKDKFAVLVHRWRQETGFSSSAQAKILHPAYQTIMTMGPAVLPLILENLEASRGHWFWALHFISGENPVPENATIDIARTAWLDWGRRKG